MTRRRCVPAITLWVAAALLSGAAFSQPATAETTMTFSHFVPTGHRVHAGAEMWAKSIEEASGGDIKVRIFPAQQLGKAADHYDMIASGQVGAGWFVSGYSPGRFPIIEAGELPFLMTDAATGARVLHEWYAEKAREEMPEIRFCLFATHDPGRIHTRAKVETISDLKGMKIRPASASVGNYLAALGAIPVKLAAPEARQGVERGVVDGVTFPWNTIINFGLAEDLVHHVDLPFYVPMAMYGVNPAFYENLSPENRKVIDDHCTPEWSERITSDWATWEQDGRQELEDIGGHTIVTVAPEDRAPWVEKAQGLYADWAAQVDQRYGDGAAGPMMEDLQARLSQAGAGF
ncbi:TRAP transporter substrate-binding protein [Microbaculum marinum]|uniref:TRAP transporter substrate-binding protein n=1 Tax=Microbaculum marinum TaxID=1764581 RepID=A0AAW9RY95_9HYPH